MSGEEEETPVKMETTEAPPKETNGNANPSASNENFVVLDTIAGGESEDLESDKEGVKEEKEDPNKKSPPKPPTSTDSPTKQVSEANPKAPSSNQRVRKKPKAPVVDVSSLRKRKWQLKVYPLHAEDLQLSYVSILCKLASESLLYIPSEGRAGKAELYVATQKETAAIIGKLLRMEFHHPLLSIEVVRKDTGGIEEGDESKKECKAFLMFDKFLSKKIFDAKGEKGMPVEKIVTLNKLPKAATKDFIGALFPFATDIDIIESDDPAERKAMVKCKTPVTSLLVYKSFKRLEINDVHVKLSVDDSVKAIKLPAVFFTPPHESKNFGPPDSIESLNKSSLPPRRPMLTPLNRRVQQIRKKALLMRRKPTRGEIMRGNRMGPGPLLDEPNMMGRRPLLGHRGPEPRGLMGPDMMRNRGMRDMRDMRDMPGGPGRRRMSERPERRGRDSMERGGGGSSGGRDSRVTREMLDLQNQLNQAIKNQIAMLNTTQGSTPGVPPMRGGMGAEHFSAPGPQSHRAPLLGPGPRGDFDGGQRPPRGMDQHHTPHFDNNAWSSDRNRMDTSDRGRIDTSERGRIDKPDRNTVRAERGVEREPRVPRGERAERSSRSERNVERGERIERPGRADRQTERVVVERVERGSRDRSEKRRSNPTVDMGRTAQRAARQVQAQAFGTSSAGSGDAVRVKERSHGGSASLLYSGDPTRGASRSGRGAEFAASGRTTQRAEAAFTSSSHSQGSGSARYGSDFTNQTQGENGSYHRRY